MCFFCFVLQILLVISGSVEVNPGPINPKLKNLSFVIWNLDLAFLLESSQGFTLLRVFKTLTILIYSEFVNPC